MKKVAILVDGNKTCTVCSESKPLSDFSPLKSGVGGVSGSCKACKTAAEKLRRASLGIPVKNLSRIEDGKKLCVTCKEMKPLDEFSPNKRGLGGVTSHCKPCFRLTYARSPEAARKATAAHRKRHPERTRARQRLYQFKRITQQIATSDGSVTDEFLKALYATEDCTYCGKWTDRKGRTADHMTPLSRGGTHTADNLVMACDPCNSSKSSKTFDEFMETFT